MCVWVGGCGWVCGCAGVGGCGRVVGGGISSWVSVCGGHLRAVVERRDANDMADGLGGVDGGGGFAMRLERSSLALRSVSTLLLRALRRARRLGVASVRAPERRLPCTARGHHAKSRWRCCGSVAAARGRERRVNARRSCVSDRCVLSACHSVRVRVSARACPPSQRAHLAEKNRLLHVENQLWRGLGGGGLLPMYKERQSYNTQKAGPCSDQLRTSWGEC